MWPSPLADQLSSMETVWFPLLVDLAIRGVALLAVTGLGILAMRRASAAARHMVWCLASLGLLVLPLLSAKLPGWHVLPVIARPAIVHEQPMVPAAQPEPPVAPAGKAIELADQPGQGHWEAPQMMAQPGAAAAVELMPPATLPLPPRRIAWQGWVVLGWLAGCFMVLGRVALGWMSLRWLEGRSTLVRDGLWPALVSRACEQLGLRRPVTLLSSSERVMPMTWGVWRTRLLVPEEAFSWPAERVRAVLLHELAHASRWDCLTQLIVQVACAVHWFNPLVWVAWRRVQTERERACDDLVLASGARASSYAEQLLQVASTMSPARLSAAAIAMARPSSLEGRLLAILDVSRNRRRLTLAATAALIVLAAGVLFPLAMAKPADPSSAPGDLLGTAASRPAPDAEARVLEGFRANRERLACGVLTWTSRRVEDGFVSERPGRLETAGAFRQWWDGPRFATAFVQDRLVAGPDQSVHVEASSGGATYSGTGRQPKLGGYENWLEQVGLLTGENASDRDILRLKELPNVSCTWFGTGTGAARRLRRMARNTQDGAFSVDDYDPARGFLPMLTEWYTGQGHLYMIREVSPLQVAGQAWIPAEINLRSRNLDGQVTLHWRFALDVPRCSFNDRSAIPADVFTMDKSRLQERFGSLLRQIYDEAAGPQVSTRPEDAMPADEAVLRRLVAKLVDAANRGDEAEVARLVEDGGPGERPADIIKELHAIIELGAAPSKIVVVRSTGKRALVATDFFELADSRYTDKQCLVYEAEWSERGWVVTDIDLENAASLIEEFQNLQRSSTDGLGHERRARAATQPAFGPRTDPRPATTQPAFGPRTDPRPAATRPAFGPPTGPRAAASRPALSSTGQVGAIRAMAIRFSSALARRDEARIARLLERGCPVDRPAELISTLGQPVPPEILAEVRVQGDRALAMTIPFNHPDYKGSICLVYGLILSGSQWLIYDIEVQDPETAALALSAIDAPIPPPATQASEAARRSLHSVSGTVFEPAQEPSQELLERMAAAGSQEEFDKIMKSVPEPKPLAGVAVRLEGKVSKFTVSDAQGHYRFDLLLRGSYRVRAERPSSPPARNAVAWASVDLHEHQNRFVDLRLSTGLVSAKGKIKDARGRPVAGAKVTAIEVEDPTIQYEGDNFQPAICSTISAADGSYEIKDLEPANWFRILPYLAKGKPDEPARFDGRAIRCVDIHISAPGLSQPANAMPRVPCLTEEHVQLARGFFKAYGQMAARAGLPAPPQAQEGLDFPPSIGHTMLVEDIALQPGESGGR